jgi:hypothetical protein
MERDEIIQMAIEAFIAFAPPDAIERFANLVAEKEREACAQLCADADKSAHPSDLAEAIRARGQK